MQSWSVSTHHFPVRLRPIEELKRVPLFSNNSYQWISSLSSIPLKAARICAPDSFRNFCSAALAAAINVRVAKKSAIGIVVIHWTRECLRIPPPANLTSRRCCGFLQEGLERHAVRLMSQLHFSPGKPHLI